MSQLETTCDKPYTSTDKWTASIISGLTFLIVSSPYTYSLTASATKSISDALSDIVGKKNGKTIVSKEFSTTEKSGCPTVPGLLIHSAVYMLIIRIMMEKRNLAGCKKPYDSKDKWIASGIGGLMFLTLSSPILYKAVDSITSQLGLNTIDDEGCPNVQGLLLHTAAFIVATRILMY